MTYPYTVKGVGLDAIFEPYKSGTKPALTHYTVNGVDLRDIFAPRYLGAQAQATNFFVNGADLNTIFAAKGSVRYSLPIDGQTFVGVSSGNVTAQMQASVTVYINADGSYNVTCIGNQQQTNQQLGNWLPAGDVNSLYQVEFLVTQTSQDTSGPSTITNSAPAYATCAANQSVQFSAQVAQTSAQAKGSDCTVVINIRNVNTGNVTSTTIYVVNDSVGTG